MRIIKQSYSVKACGYELCYITLFVIVREFNNNVQNTIGIHWKLCIIEKCIIWLTFAPVYWIQNSDQLSISTTIYHTPNSNALSPITCCWVKYVSPCPSIAPAETPVPGRGYSRLVLPGTYVSLYKAKAHIVPKGTWGDHVTKCVSWQTTLKN